MSVEQEIRQYLAKRYKCDPNADIQVHGNVVDVRGIMPNTQSHGQFRAGNLNDLKKVMELDAKHELV